MDGENIKEDSDGAREKGSRLWLWIIVGLIVLAGGLIYFTNFKKTAAPLDTKESKTATTETTKTVAKTWSDGQVAIAGNFADAEVIDLGPSTSSGQAQFRMYYSIEPEVAGNKLEMYSALSTDGINWTKEVGERKTFATFPDVVKLADGSFRIYFQNAGVIKSATSSDGLKLTDETGTRIDKAETGYNLSNVGAQSTIRLSDGSFLMAYRGLIEQPYSTTEKLPNQTTGLFFFATSADGLTWQKKGLAVDSRNETLLGSIDGAEWVKWDDGVLRLYYWSYTGVYYSTYKDGVFSKPVLDLPASKEANVRFAPNPPGDPTLAKINDQWFMYYGQHQKGIYYTELK